MIDREEMIATLSEMTMCEVVDYSIKPAKDGTFVVSIKIKPTTPEEAVDLEAMVTQGKKL